MLYFRDWIDMTTCSRWLIKRMAAAAAVLAATTAFAADFPVKPVRIITPFPPGGSVDLVARLLAADLGKAWGQQVIVDNRSGASGNIGTEAAKNAAPDGHTLLLNTLPFVTNQFVYSTMPYDPITDFAPISLVSSVASLLVVHPSLPVHSVRELIALAKSKPGAINYATAGAATNPHIAGELLNYLGKINLFAVHYKGGGPATAATISGEVQVFYSNTIADALPQVEAKRLRALGVTSIKRSPIAPGPIAAVRGTDLLREMASIASQVGRIRSLESAILDPLRISVQA